MCTFLLFVYFHYFFLINLYALWVILIFVCVQNSYKMYGYGEWIAAFKGNTVRGYLLSYILSTICAFANTVCA